jgi:hypothetical protein
MRKSKAEFDRRFHQPTDALAVCFLTVDVRRASAACAGQELVKEESLPMRPLAVVLVIAVLLAGVACHSGDGASDSQPAGGKAVKEKSDSSFRNLGKRGESES